jgi:hypothetical protein
MPQAAAQGESGDARGRDQAARRGKPMPLGGLVENTPGDAPSRPGSESPNVAAVAVKDDPRLRSLQHMADDLAAVLTLSGLCGPAVVVGASLRAPIREA